MRIARLADLLRAPSIQARQQSQGRCRQHIICHDEALSAMGIAMLLRSQPFMTSEPASRFWNTNQLDTPCELARPSNDDRLVTRERLTRHGVVVQKEEGSEGRTRVVVVHGQITMNEGLPPAYSAFPVTWWLQLQPPLSTKAGNCWSVVAPSTTCHHWSI